MQLNRECLKWERMVLKGEKLTLFFIWVSQFTCNWYIDYQLSKGNKTDWILEQSEVTQNGLYMNPSLILKQLIFSDFVWLCGENVHCIHGGQRQLWGLWRAAVQPSK